MSQRPPFIVSTADVPRRMGINLQKLPDALRARR